MSDVGDRALSGAQRAKNSDLLEHGVRAGFVAYGVVHLVIGFLAVQLALGQSQGKASSTGALNEVAQQPFGIVLLWLIVVGMFVLVAWRLFEVTMGRRSEESGDPEIGMRLASGLKAVIYAVLGYSAVKVAVGSGGGGSGKGGRSSEEAMTATVMNWPAGQWLVVAGALAIIGYGGFLIYQGWDDKHAKHLESEGRSGQAGRAYLLLGKIGYTAKGVALLLVGGLLAWAGVTHESGKSAGIDQALATLLKQPFGSWMVGMIGVGLGCYGLFCFARARHLSR